MESRNRVRGIAHNKNVAKITVLGVPDRAGISAAIFSPLAEKGISVDTIVQNASVDHITDLTFTVARADLEEAIATIEPVATNMGARGCITDSKLANVSIVGTGMQHYPGYASRMFQALYEADVNIEMITTAEIRITCIVAEDKVEAAVSALHRAFQLDEVD